MFRREFVFNGSIEDLSEIIAADMINGLKELVWVKEPKKKDVVDRQKVIDEIDRYFGEVATKALHDGESPDFDKVFEAMRDFSELSKRIKKIK